MLSKITGVNLYGFKPQVTSATEYRGEPKYIQTSFAPQYNASHPRVNDSEGVVNESPLARQLDIIS